ncbi:TetR family transcriptional regulator [Flavobacterium akiainvivens]|uniref:TetR family transcriptional regulator n=1 Tax=Flavobacterium akiainvivens TaxID=1202724 RepID=A0A0M9VK24_9FLAO|nr:TetR/AcrR family transcriptional regulator [Flavobacterium akiainvivens]KOS08082.1 TetR family transcriptional regulator [Flavobacterium akiainvivens]SFQ71655.1 transcriptional regulator, TetR family [Flavobacterium akiainvivens]
MTDKTPPGRNKERSKQQLLDAVGKLLKTEGFTGLKVNDIAATAGLDKKLIYKYFGSRDNLVDEYISSLDFWSNVSQDQAPPVITDGGQDFTKHMLLQQYDVLDGNDELQKLMMWGLYESRKSLKAVADEREAVGEVLLTNITDPFFGKFAKEYRSTVGILIAGIYYMNMYAGVNCNTFCGIDITQPEGKQDIKNALVNLVDLFYKDIEAKKQEG